QALRGGHPRGGVGNRAKPRQRRRGARDPRARDGAARRPARNRRCPRVIVALSSGVTTAWWIALAVGLVVAVVVVALLEALRRTVLQIARGAEDILTVGGRLAQNTWTIQLLNMANLHAGELLEELRRHT